MKKEAIGLTSIEWAMLEIAEQMSLRQKLRCINKNKSLSRRQKKDRKEVIRYIYREAKKLKRRLKKC